MGVVAHMPSPCTGRGGCKARCSYGTCQGFCPLRAPSWGGLEERGGCTSSCVCPLGRSPFAGRALGFRSTRLGMSSGCKNLPRELPLPLQSPSCPAFPSAVLVLPSPCQPKQVLG